MHQQIAQPPQPEELHKNTKANRFQQFQEPLLDNKQTWPSDAVVYIGHLPHGFMQDQIKSYFTQYGEVFAVKVARSKLTARSKGYAFIQFKYPQVAQIVSDTMNGYLLLGKVLVSQVLPPNKKNPFTYHTSKQYTFINWKKNFVEKKNATKTEEQTANIVHHLLKKEQGKRTRFQELGIDYKYPGFSSHVPKPSEEPKQAKKSKKDKNKSK